eukprot:scaffold4358_cov177-Ochromonas_danica.AAC.4
MGDRSGGREPKGASLKKSKKNPGASAAKAKKASLKAQGLSNGPLTSLPPPIPLNQDGLYFDCGIALLSRQFDRDRDRVLQRAQGEGIHPDNIDRTNKKSHEEWLEKIEELGKRAECLAILSGLNLSREMATHFSQESLLKTSYSLAVKLQLPLILHIADAISLDRALELLFEGEQQDDNTNTLSVTAGAGIPVLIHDVVTATGAEDRFRYRPSSTTASSTSTTTQLFYHPQLYYIISAAGITDHEKENLYSISRSFIEGLPLEKMLVASDSPWRTPQTLSDPYLRTLRNEPSNLPAIVEVIAEIKGQDKLQMAKILEANTLQVLGLVRSDPLNGANAITANMTHLTINNSIDNNNNDNDTVSHEQDDDKREEKVKEEENDNNNNNNNNNGDDNELEHSQKTQTQTVTESSTASATTTTTSAGEDSVFVPYYCCSKCRVKVFTRHFLISHSETTVKKTVFKVGDEGLCESFVFVDLSTALSSLSVSGGSIACAACGAKLGKYAVTEAWCACGKAVPGPCAKLLASKLDYVDCFRTTDRAIQLAERAKMELELRGEEGEDDVAGNAEKRKIKKGKKHKSENRGNFSSFRNKSFVPNASKQTKQSQSSGGGGNGGGSGDEVSDGSADD